MMSSVRFQAIAPRMWLDFGHRRTPLHPVSARQCGLIMWLLSIRPMVWKEVSYLNTGHRSCSVEIQTIISKFNEGLLNPQCHQTSRIELDLDYTCILQDQLSWREKNATKNSRAGLITAVLQLCYHSSNPQTTGSLQMGNFVQIRFDLFFTITMYSHGKAK